MVPFNFSRFQVDSRNFPVGWGMRCSSFGQGTGLEPFNSVLVVPYKVSVYYRGVNDYL